MLIIPAIDLKNGYCVRLYKGSFKKELFKKDPLEAAKKFKEAGASRLHIVDLDGAKTGYPVNLKIALEIKKSTGLEIELGGGIRTVGILERILREGIDYAIIGTLALKEEIRKVGEKSKIIISIDIDEEGFVKSHGWRKKSALKGWELIESLYNHGFMNFIITLTHRDGTLEGIDESLIVKFLKNRRVNLIFAGGISSIRDIECLSSLGVHGIIIGRALYEGKLSLEVIKSAGKKDYTMP